VLSHELRPNLPNLRNKLFTKNSQPLIYNNFRCKIFRHELRSKTPQTHNNDSDESGLFCDKTRQEAPRRHTISRGGWGTRSEISERLRVRDSICWQQIPPWSALEIEASSLNTNQLRHRRPEFRATHNLRRRTISAKTFEETRVVRRIHSAPLLFALSASSFAVSDDRQNGQTHSQWNLQCNAG
jgi:hypothetical protein